MREYLDQLDGRDAAAVVAAMAEVEARGLGETRHLRGRIWEVRVHGDRVALRVLFAPVGAHGVVLLALAGYSKKTQKAPARLLELAEWRLRDWETRGGKQ